MRGELKSILSENTEKPNTGSTTAIISTFNPSETIAADIWSHALFVLRSPPRQFLPDLLADPGCVKELAATNLKGKPVYRIRIMAERKRRQDELEVWIDPQHNFLVKKMVSRSFPEGSCARYEKEVLHFQEFLPGIYFPTETETRLYVKDPKGKGERLWQLQRVRFKSVVINKPIDPGVFQLRIPPESNVIDLRRGMAYVSGPDGAPKGGKVAPPPISKEVSAPGVVTHGGAPPVWLLSGAVCVAAALASACVVVCWRRKKPG